MTMQQQAPRLCMGLYSAAVRLDPPAYQTIPGGPGDVLCRAKIMSYKHRKSQTSAVELFLDGHLHVDQIKKYI